MINNKNMDCVYENKFWISITGLCNNNCKFCLDSNRTDKFHKPLDEIKEKIKIAKTQNSKLIISGGDPTIHPNLEEIIKYAKELGYKKIQVITNGRMFASKEFTNKIISAGIDEITFSVHGFNKEIHDYLTSVPDSFNQIIKGILNVKQNKINDKIIINTDTCVTKKNYKQILKTIKFIYQTLKINEINLMIMLPEGNAWKNKKDIMVNPKVLLPYIKEVLDYSKKQNINLWLSRFPTPFLENYEMFIEDPHKKIDEVKGRIKIFENKQYICKGNKCVFCPIKDICKSLRNIEKIKNKEKKLKKKFTNIQKLNLKNINIINQLSLEKNKNLIIPNIHEKLIDFEKDLSLSDLLKKITYNKNISFANIPFCILKKSNILQKKYIEFNGLNLEKENDVLKITKILSINLKTKLEKCKNCILKNKCKGINVNYIKNFGSKEINPIIEK